MKKIEDVKPGEKFRIAGQEFMKIESKYSGLDSLAVAISDGYHKIGVVLEFHRGTYVEVIG